MKTKTISNIAFITGALLAMIPTIIMIKTANPHATTMTKQEADALFSVLMGFLITGIALGIALTDKEQQ